LAPSRGRRGTLGTVLLLAPFAFLGGAVADCAVHAAGGGGDTYRSLDLFARVLSYVENNYVEDVSGDVLIEGAIKGMVEKLDPHSLYMPADVFKQLKAQTEGEFGGVGCELTLRQATLNGVRAEYLTVVASIDETPASRAGIRAGDIIVKIDGESTADVNLLTAVSKLQGPPGTRVVLSIMRDGFAQPRDIPVVRDNIRVVSVEGRLIDGFGYVKIKSFQEQTDVHLRKALEDLKKAHRAPLKGLVLDLRNNPGGLLEQAVRVADIILPGGKLIVTPTGRNGHHVEEERSHDRGTEPDYPLILLVNRGSASSSEIVAGALQDHGRAVLMGTQTFGKGSVQTLIELEDGGGLKLTIARYFTPKNRSIQDTGIAPDIRVEEKEDGEDRVLRTAIDYLKTGPSPASPAAARP